MVKLKVIPLSGAYCILKVSILSQYLTFIQFILKVSKLKLPSLQIELMQHKTDNFYNRETTTKLQQKIEKTSTKHPPTSSNEYELNDSPIFSSSEDEDSDESGEGLMIQG